MKLLFDENLSRKLVIRLADGLILNIVDMANGGINRDNVFHVIANVAAHPQGSA